MKQLTVPPSLAATGFQEMRPVLALLRAKGDGMTVVNRADSASVEHLKHQPDLHSYANSGVNLFNSDDQRSALWFPDTGIVHRHKASLDDRFPETHTQVYLGEAIRVRWTLPACVNAKTVKGGAILAVANSIQ